MTQMAETTPLYVKQFMFHLQSIHNEKLHIFCLLLCYCLITTVQNKHNAITVSDQKAHKIKFAFAYNQIHEKFFDGSLKYILCLFHRW